MQTHTCEINNIFDKLSMYIIYTDVFSHRFSSEFHHISGGSGQMSTYFQIWVRKIFHAFPCNRSAKIYINAENIYPEIRVDAPNRVSRGSSRFYWLMTVGRPCPPRRWLDFFEKFNYARAAPTPWGEGRGEGVGTRPSGGAVKYSSGAQPLLDVNNRIRVGYALARQIRTVYLIVGCLDSGRFLNW